MLVLLRRITVLTVQVRPTTEAQAVVVRPGLTGHLPRQNHRAVIEAPLQQEAAVVAASAAQVLHIPAQEVRALFHREVQEARVALVVQEVPAVEDPEAADGNQLSITNYENKKTLMP